MGAEASATSTLTAVPSNPRPPLRSVTSALWRGQLQGGYRTDGSSCKELHSGPQVGGSEAGARNRLAVAPHRADHQTLVPGSPFLLLWEETLSWGRLFPTRPPCVVL